LLTAVNAGDPASSGFESIEAFEKYLTTRKLPSKKPYGIFDKDGLRAI